MSSASRFTVESQDGITIITLTDAALQETAMVTDLEVALLEFLDARSPTKLVIDFRNVTQCSTAVINGLLRVKKRLVTSGGSLRLCEMRKNIYSAFRMLNLTDSVFQVDDRRDESIAELQE